MFGFSFGEMLLLGALALIIIGPKQLPEVARQVGRILNEIKRTAGGFMDEFKQAGLHNDYMKHISTPQAPAPKPVSEEKTKLPTAESEAIVKTNPSTADPATPKQKPEA